MNEDHKLERWSVCNRYKNYKSNNYYKEPLQFRPHPENVVRDVIMYHIYHNEGQILCEDTLVQYIKNKIIDDLNVIFMLYQYAPDAISTIDRLMSSKRHLGTEDSYHEMMFHALTMRDARNVLIEQISNVLIKCIPEPLGNVNFDVIMKDENMNNNTKESSIEEDIKNDREVRIENREKEFSNCKSETEKAMLFPRHDLLKLAVEDIITDAVERYQNEHNLVFEAKLKGEIKHISKETIMSGFIFLAMGHIKQTFIVDDIAVKQIEKSIEHILNDSLNDPTREKGIDYISTIIWYSFYDTYFKNALAFPKPVEESSTDTADKPFDFAVKSVSAKLYNHIFKIVRELVDESCDHVEDMTIASKTFEVNPEIGYDEYKVLMLTGTIGYHLSVTLDIDMERAHEEAYEAIVNKFKFKHCLDPKSNEAFIKHMTDFVCRNLSFDKSIKLEKEALQSDQEIETAKSDVKENKEHPKETIMKGNPQNIEVGDVITFRNTTSIVLEVTINNSTGNCSITVYFNGKSHKVDVQVEDVRIVRKWDGSIPSEQAKQSEVKSQSTYLLGMLSDKSIETIELAVELIEGLSSADIVEVYRDNKSVVVTQNFVNKLCEFVNTKRHLKDRYIKFDGSDFWDNLEILHPQSFLDYIAERIIVEELKKRTLANE